jgi:SAM-dependent methyltransferase
MRIADLMNHTWAYKVWQAPFAESKFRPLLARTDMRRVRRVLDVGCGPGTNVHHFRNVEYVGLDINPGYIADARARHGRDFRVADVTQLDPATLQPADMILLNSLLHHLDDAEVHRLLAALPPLLAPGGAVHILDLVLPERASIHRLMAKLDRGLYARPLDAWRAIFSSHFSVQLFEPYTFGGLWSMVYFRGAALA